jgi:hypothetical protein
MLSARMIWSVKEARSAPLRTSKYSLLLVNLATIELPADRPISACSSGNEYLAGARTASGEASYSVGTERPRFTVGRSATRSSQAFERGNRRC